MPVKRKAVVPIKDDNILEEIEHFKARIVLDSGVLMGVKLGEPLETTVEISDNDGEYIHRHSEESCHYEKLDNYHVCVNMHITWC